jgi:hypothetical protein
MKTPSIAIPAQAWRAMPNQPCEELKQQKIDRAIAILEDALARCRNEDVRTVQVYAALKVLEQYVDPKWPLNQFCEALENDGPEARQAEGRWQNVNASLNGIKLAVKELSKS